jgi:hypothetical protein
MAVFDKMTTYPVHGFRKSEELRCDVFSESKLHTFVLCALSKSFNSPKHVSLRSKGFSQNDEFDFYLMEVLCCVPKILMGNPSSWLSSMLCWSESKLKSVEFMSAFEN